MGYSPLGHYESDRLGTHPLRTGTVPVGSSGSVLQWTSDEAGSPPDVEPSAVLGLVGSSQFLSYPLWLSCPLPSCLTYILMVSHHTEFPLNHSTSFP